LACEATAPFIGASGGESSFWLRRLSFALIALGPPSSAAAHGIFAKAPIPDSAARRDIEDLSGADKERRSVR
jgi:hypothetical protein